MPVTILNSVPNPPKFAATEPNGEPDWQQLYRWFVQAQQAILQSTLEGTLADLKASPPGHYLPGTPFFVTDFGITYLQVGGKWMYQTGQASGLQASLILLALGANDVGFLFNVTDYAHVLRWNGFAWEWGPGDSGSGYLQLFEIDPTAAGWRLYDGSTVPYLKSDGTLGVVSLENVVDHPSFLVVGPLNTGINPATAPLATGGGGVVGANTTGITVDATANDGGGGTVVQSGSGTTVAAHTHTHPSSAITDPGHAHSFTPVQPTISTDGTPQNLVRRAWFRQ